MVLEKDLKSPLDCKEIKPVNPKGNQSWISLEGLMLKLKLQYFGHLFWRTDSLEKTLMLGKIEGRRRRGRGWNGWMASLTQWTWVWASSESWWWTGKPGMLQSMGCKEFNTTEWLNWTEPLPAPIFFFLRQKSPLYCSFFHPSWNLTTRFESTLRCFFPIW